MAESFLLHTPTYVRTYIPKIPPISSQHNAALSLQYLNW